jgi:hypothetical protein
MMARLAVASGDIANQGIEDGQTASEQAEIVRRLDTEDDALRSTAACFAGVPELRPVNALPGD